MIIKALLFQPLLTYDGDSNLSVETLGLESCLCQLHSLILILSIGEYKKEELLEAARYCHIKRN